MMRIQKMLICGMVVAMVATGSGITAFAAESSAKDDEIARIISQKLDNIKVVRSADSSTTGSSSLPAGTKSNLTKDELKAYADKVFELVNKEREKEGVALLERSDALDEAANTRALDCASVNSIRVDGKAHTRPDGSRWFTVLGIDQNYHYGENTDQGKITADAQMRSWMGSEGHKSNILYDRYTEIGIGCAVSEQGEIFAVQIFYRP